MRPTQSFLRQKFNEYNVKFFAGELREIPIEIRNLGRKLGHFAVTYHRNFFHKSVGAIKIGLSDRYDLEQDVVEDVLLHEMIHYYLWTKNIADNRVHGENFRKIMMRINREGGRHITVTHNTTTEEAQSDRSVKDHYICVIYIRNREPMFYHSPRTRIFEAHRTLSTQVRNLIGIQWYWTRDKWFNRYPFPRTLKCFELTEEDNAHLRSAVRCECDGNRFQPVKNQSDSD